MLHPLLLFFLLGARSVTGDNFVIFSTQRIQIFDPSNETLGSFEDTAFPLVWDKPAVKFEDNGDPVAIIIETNSYYLLIPIAFDDYEYSRVSEADDLDSAEWSDPVLGETYLLIPSYYGEGSEENLYMTALNTNTMEERQLQFDSPIQHVVWVPLVRAKTHQTDPTDFRGPQEEAPEMAIQAIHELLKAKDNDDCAPNTNCVDCQPRTATPYCPDPGVCGYDPVVNCTDCMSGMAMPECPYPGACGYTGQTGCVGCTSGVATSGCPDPSKCGFAAIPECTMCMSGMCMPDCPWPQLCPSCVGCAPPPNCAGCMNGMAMPGCPDPGACGFAPIVYYNTDCVQCVARKNTTYCQDPGQCDYDPVVNCTNCMSGMAMPLCPYPGACPGGYDGQPGCKNCQSYVSTTDCPDPSACGFAAVPQCDGCVSGTMTTGCPWPQLCPNCKGCNPPPDCAQCVDSESTPGCPDPSKCGKKPIEYYNTDCVLCVDRTAEQYCPNPYLCGYDPIITCVGCMDGMAMPNCPYPAPCNYTGQTNCTGCISREATETCPDPGNCGYAYIPQCDGCISGVWQEGCPFPDHCNSSYAPIPNCGGCVWGKNTTACPNPAACGLSPPNGPQCVDCMCGMYMNTCPDLSVCGFDCGSSCVMESTFGFSHDICVLLSDWKIGTTAEYTGTIIGVIALCFLREWLSVHRTKSQLKKNSSAKCADDEESKETPLLRPREVQAHDGNRSERCCGDQSISHLQFINSLWYLFSLFAAYIIMMIIMTYDVGLFITVIASCGLAHFVWHYLYFSKSSSKNTIINSS